MFILPKVPSFGEKLGQSIGAGLSNAAQLGIEKAKESRRQKMLEQIEELGGQRKTSPSIFSTDLEQGQPSISGRPPFEEEDPFAKAKAYARIGEHELTRVATEEGKQRSKELSKQREKSETRERSQQAFDRMGELLNSGDLGIGSKIKSMVPTEKGARTAETIGEFESLSGALESMLVEMVNKGTLSNTRFRYITETLLPKPNDREATIRGKLKGLSKELGLNPKSLERSSDKSFKKNHVKIRSPEGEEFWIPKDEIKSAQEAGGKVIR